MGATVVSTVTKKVMGQFLTLAILCGGIFLHFSACMGSLCCVRLPPTLAPAGRIYGDRKWMDERRSVVINGNI